MSFEEISSANYAPEYSHAVGDFMAISHNLIRRYPAENNSYSSQPLIYGRLSINPLEPSEYIVVTTPAPQEVDGAAPNLTAAGTPQIAYTVDFHDGSYEAGEYTVQRGLVTVKGTEWNHEETASGSIEPTERVLSYDEVLQLTSRLKEAHPLAKSSASPQTKFDRLAMRFHTR